MEEISAVEQGIPIVDVAAIFQKDPQVLIAHPDQGIEKFEDLAKADTIFLGKDGYLTFFEWMKANFKGFRDEQYKPYNFNPGPFLADPKSAQQGYLTSEPYEIAKQAGWEPKVFLIADAGYSAYSTMITAQASTIADNPDLVQRFVDASIIGWYNYLPGHLEFIRFNGAIQCAGLPLVRYTTEARLEEIIRIHEDNGCPIFNPHRYTLEEGGMKRTDAVQLAFKQETDPKGLLNPGKMIAWENPDFDFKSGRTYLFPGLEELGAA